jgi:hypothetical protein
MEGSMPEPKILLSILLVVPATMFLAARSSFGGSTNGECRASPGESAPAGLHWYYHTDRTNNRHCWSLHSNGVQVHAQQDVVSPNPKPRHEVAEHTKNIAEQPQGMHSQNDTVQAALQTPINSSDNNLVAIATGNTFQQVIGSNGNAKERQALIIKNDNSNGDSCWVFFGGDKASKEKGVMVTAGDSYVRYWPFVSSETIQATCASTSDALYVEIK